MLDIKVEVSQRDIARVDKRLEKFQGKPLAERTLKALSGGASLLVGPIRQLAPVSPSGQTGKYAHPSGNLRRKVRTRKLRNQPGEIAAYYAGPAVYYGLFVNKGTRYQQANPFVERATAQVRDQVNAYVSEKITSLK